LAHIPRRPAGSIAARRFASGGTAEATSTGTQLLELAFGSGDEQVDVPGCSGIGWLPALTAAMALPVIRSVGASAIRERALLPVYKTARARTPASVADAWAARDPDVARLHDARWAGARLSKVDGVASSQRPRASVRLNC
jgi:hypothetical protein